MAILLALPARILFDHYSPDSGFLDLIQFGQELKGTVLPEVREISPVTSWPWGYDGQFYAQIALRPRLADDALVRALDNPRHRSLRIGLPFLSFCLGVGKPAWILQVYALLNFGFWLLLLVAISRFVGYHSFRDMLLAFALLWSTGTLASVGRALIDFPAAVLGVLAVVSNSKWIVATILLAFAGLFKETSVLSLAAVPWRERPQGFDIKRMVISALIIVLPITLWLMYVHVRLPFVPGSGAENFAFPFFGIVHKLYSGVHDMAIGWAGAPIYYQVELLFEVLCPLSLVIQAAYLFAKPRIRSEAWRFGIGFAIFLSILGQDVWDEQYAYCRVLLPLTFSFNLLIHKHESGPRFAFWYLVGNGGMCWLVLHYQLY